MTVYMVQAPVCNTGYRSSILLTVSMALKHLLDDVCSCKAGKWDRYLHEPLLGLEIKLDLQIFFVYLFYENKNMSKVRG